MMKFDVSSQISRRWHENANAISDTELQKRILILSKKDKKYNDEYLQVFDLTN